MTTVLKKDTAGVFSAQQLLALVQTQKDLLKTQKELVTEQRRTNQLLDNISGNLEAIADAIRANS